MKPLAVLSQRVCTALILLAVCPLTAWAATRVDLSGDITPGITVHGLGPRLWYYKEWPTMHAHRDIWGAGAEVWNEFTMHQTIGKTAIMCLYLAAVDSL